ncbi:hypothetical protein DEG02_007840 [Xanthomonas vasicola]|nr:hypothetical protein NX80_006755 [Xanthomonas vasicola pv. arecae]AZR31493.1 hypothetical protein KWO_014120 [Xanthomonas vasicola pv. musacearum NCPPB 4379]RJL87968.1 hypothetical protein DEG03_001560 [Xanthomonas vasicola]RRJ44812.1 hypothetical protein EIM46_01255 [Xanthomonas vasicola pv. musacearum]RJL90001.1 hypothetical protein DEF98_000315 [Xanthomonas vasicola]
MAACGHAGTAMYEWFLRIASAGRASLACTQWVVSRTKFASFVKAMPAGVACSAVMQRRADG